MPRSIKPAVLVILFIIGALLGAMAAFIVASTRMDTQTVLTITPMWLSRPDLFGWWAWALGGGLVVSLAYAARQLSRD